MKYSRPRRYGANTERLEWQLTAMIDIVFLLLIFFVMTFRVVAVEADFAFAVPTSGGRPVLTELYDFPIRLTVQLESDEAGKLTAVLLDNRRLIPEANESVIEALHRRIRYIVEGEGREPAKTSRFEVEFRCDFGLKYQHLIAAITAVSGYRTGAAADALVVDLIKTIRFAPPRHVEDGP